jgi:hypothetical protein|tara:strand:+ start:305 stop:592 length:288 start_codon:yes stop_codon:yes gene_type:complete
MTDRESLKKALREVIVEEIAHLRIKESQHFRDHEKVQKIEYADITFVMEMRKFVETVKDSFWRTLIRALVGFGLVVFTGGIWAYFKYKGHLPPSH